MKISPSLSFVIPHMNTCPLKNKTCALLLTIAAISGTQLPTLSAENTTPPVQANIAGMKSMEAPREIAPGVWSLRLGAPEKEISYTSLADRAPRMKELAAYPARKFPFAPGDMRFTMDGDNNIGLRIPAPPSEEIFGFGLQLDGIKKRNRVLDLRVDHWGDGEGPTHAPVPFYLSSRGYGIFINTARPLKVYAQVGNRKDAPHFPTPVDRNPPPGEKTAGWDAQPIGDAVEIQTHAHGLEIIVFTGENAGEIIAKYNLYNGGGALPPLWGLGFWHRVPAQFTADETNREAALFAEKNIPLDVIGLEPGWMTKSYPCTFEWQKKRFPDPKTFTANLLAKGIRLNLWENPYISPEAKLHEPMLPYTGSHTVWLGTVPDYTLPEARKLIADQHKTEHIDIGISGYKTDETDGYDQWLWPNHAQFPSGIGGAAMRQIYGLALQKAYQEDIFRKNNIRSYGQVRSSNGGASGYPNALYSDAYSHKQFITGVSSASLCGVLWCPEIRSAGNAKEWLCRMQSAVFSPLAQLNAWASGTKPWSYPEVEKEVKELIELRMRFLPYLYNAFAEYNQKGIPPFRAMILESETKTKEIVKKEKLDDTANPYETAKVVEVTDQYMMGPSIMVAPFYENKSDQREVSLPPGDWYDFYTGKLAGNNQNIMVKNDGKVPLFVKDGAIIPLLAKSVKNTDEAYQAPLELRYYGKKDNVATLYEDDGKSFDYEKGKYRVREFAVSTNKETGKPELKEKMLKDDAPALYGKVEQFRVMGQP